MAKRQSRRTVSLNRIDYEAAKQEAAKRGMTLSALVEAALGAFGVPIVAHVQQSPDLVRRSAAVRAERLAARQGDPLPSRERQVLGDEVADMCGFA